MNPVKVAIVGGGLSGLHAANLLQQSGIHDWVLLEARTRLGGRIVSVASTGLALADKPGLTDGIDRFDLGPTWFWPGHQHQFDQLVRNLGLARFAQHEQGATVIERSPGEPPMRVQGMTSSPPSMRLVGGMGALVDALQRSLDPGRVITGQAVQQMRLDGNEVVITTRRTDGDNAGDA